MEIAAERLVRTVGDFEGEDEGAGCLTGMGTAGIEIEVEEMEVQEDPDPSSIWNAWLTLVEKNLRFTEGQNCSKRG